jgi:hypothetical protein
MGEREKREKMEEAKSKGGREKKTTKRNEDVKKVKARANPQKRLAETSGITKTLSEGTTLFAVVLVLDDAVARWGILASLEPEAAIDAYQKEFLGPVASRTALDVVAIIISIAAVIIASVISCVTWRQRGYKVVN